ncbi:MAG: hypothetical protein K2L07_01950 [Lachnospiraceae bacterium]|nr:hypothetical protein [Lachnospiraceae bacterium]
MKRIKRGCCYLLLVLSILYMAGCNSIDKKSDDTEMNTENSQREMEETGKKHPEYDRSAAIVLETELDFEAREIEYFDDVVELYQDKGLHHKIYCQYDWDKEQKTLSLLPPQYPLLNVSTTFASKSLMHEFEHSDYHLFEKGANNDWGNLGKMYLVKWLDLQDGGRLADPEVTEITIKGELDAPRNFQFEVSEYGNGTLFWEPVKGAERYLIISATYLTQNAEISGFYQECDIVAETSDTRWQSETEGDIMNGEFQTVYDTEEDREYYYGVLAVGKEGTSMVSNLISKREMAKRLPYCKEENGVEGEASSARFAKSIDLLPGYHWIQLCDGTMSQHLIRYGVDEAEPVNITDWEEEPKEMLAVPYIIEGTDFEGSFYVEEFDQNTYPEDLKKLQERQNILKSKMTGILENIETTVKPKVEENAKTKGKEAEDAKAVVDSPNGTTELSRYLAAGLLQEKEFISVADVEQDLNKEILTDAFYEAYFQNPLIPAVKEINISESGTEISISYEETAAERKRKQKELIEKVNFVAGELEEEGMSDVNKVLIINSYLCDNVAYDMTAAEQSEEGIFTDSMTPYGVLINHKGVCLGYAGAFQLLAKEMGLDSIVVTGTLNGNEKHAWNKVKIDGKWCVVDVTSNDSDEIGNVLLNVSDKTADYLLKEDAHYICDESLGNFAADTEEFEYYHLAGKYYDKTEIAGAFIQELSLGDKAVFRTDTTLTNEEFQDIVREVMEGMEQEQMQGYYRLGVIYLSRK